MSRIGTVPKHSLEKTKEIQYLLDPILHATFRTNLLLCASNIQLHVIIVVNEQLWNDVKEHHIHSWFQTFAVYLMLYAVFLVIHAGESPRRIQLHVRV
jgi:hypothetical protein